MYNLILKYSLALMVFSLCCAPGAFAALGSKALSGYAEWSWADYSLETKAVDYQASHFTQKYSLVYSKKGYVNGGRAGFYDFGIGAEWTSFETDIDGRSIDKDTTKILFNGEFSLQPGGLPFRLHLYSFDRRSPSFINNSLNFGTFIVAPDIVTDITNGQSIISGATLMVGIKNGSYMGRYRELLSKYPKLFFDYKQIYTRDMKREFPVHSMMKELAFVSLNKKDNWFHYRFSEYTDYMDAREDWTEKKYIVGTVDHLLRREWINLTNWIKISADGTLTETNRPNSQALAQAEIYDLNLFTRAKYNGWQFNNFTTFSRTNDSDRYMRRDLIVPLQGAVVLDYESDFKFSLIMDRDEDIDLLAGNTNGRDSYYGIARLTRDKRQRFVNSPFFEAVATRSSGVTTLDGKGVRVGTEWYSSRKYRANNRFYVHADVAYFTTENGSKNDYTEFYLKLSGDTYLTPNMRTGLTQDIVLGSGELASGGFDYMSARGGSGLPSQKNDAQGRSDVTVRSHTRWYLDHQRGRIKNRLRLNFDYLSTGEETGVMEFSANHILRYDKKYMQLSLDSTYFWSDQPVDNLSGTSGVINAGASSRSNQYFNHNGYVSYRPSRVWNARGNWNFTWDEGDGGDNFRIRLEEHIDYNLYTVNGIVRKFMDFEQEFLYEYYDSDGEVEDGYRFSIGMNYYPYQLITLGSELRYRWNSETDDDLYCRLFASVNYPKMTIELDYKYGLLPADGGGRTEQRWELLVRKMI